MPKVPKIRFHIFAIAPKNVVDEVDTLPTNKDESFQQIDSISFDVCSKLCQKYPKQQLCNTFAISQGKREG